MRDMHLRSMLIPVVLLLLACSGQERSASTGVSVNHALTAVGVGSQTLSGLASDLTALVRADDAATVKAAYLTFTERHSALQSHVARIGHALADVRQKGQVQARQWAASLDGIQSAEVTATSRDRLDQLRAGLERLDIVEREFNEARDPYLKSVTDLRLAFDLDLTPAGIGALKPAIKAIVTATPLLDAKLTLIHDRLQDLEAFLGGPQPAAAAPKTGP